MDSSEKLGSLIKTAKDSLKLLLENKPVISDRNLQEKRLKICLDCPHCTQDMFCSICGCNLNVKTKVIAAYCPEKPPKW